MEYEADTYYARITEKFRKVDGTRSDYDMLSGNGEITMQLHFNRTGYIESKENAIFLVEQRLTKFIGDLSTFKRTQTKTGLKYERFVVLDEEDYSSNPVEEGKHTDHEVYDVYIFYIEEVSDGFSRL